MSDRNFPPDEEAAPQATLKGETAVRQMSVGAELAAQRQAKGWTVEQVASSLKLAPRQVEAIEADNHSMLPGIAVTRGFIRAYAKLLRIDAVPLLAAMGSATETVLPGNRVAAAPFSDAKRSTFGKKRSKSKLVVGLFLLGGAAAVALGFQQLSALLPSIKQLASRQQVETPEVVFQPGIPEPAVPAMPDVAATASSEAGSANTAAEEVMPVENNGLPAAAAPSTDTAASSKGSSDTASSTNNLLQITMKQDSWLEVKRVADNNVLAARLVKAGTVETFEVDGPIKLTVGNIAGVEAVLRGEPIQLRTAGGGNVARLTIK